MTWVAFEADGRIWSAARVGGASVEGRPGQWYIHTGFDLSKRRDLTTAEIQALAMCAPSGDSPPPLPVHTRLVSARGGAADEGAPQEDLGKSWIEDPNLHHLVAGIIAGTITRPAPTIGLRTDGQALIYAGRVNGLVSESGTGKTFLALAIAAQEIDQDHHVVLIDLEDRAEGIITRLLDLGVSPEAIVRRFHYLSPDEPFGLAAEEHVAHLVLTHRPTLVIIDSTGESMAVDGVKPNDDDAVARWFRRFPRKIANTGPAVLTLDHVTKNPEGRGLYAIGSQRKRAAINGASYILEPIREFGQGRAGAVKLIVAKDRQGTYVRGARAAEFHLDATTTPYTATLAPPGTGSDDVGGFQPTHLMEKVSRYLEVHPGASKGEVEGAKLGKTDYVRQALDHLVNDGFVATERAGNATRHRVINTYRETPENGSEKAQ